MTIRFKLMALTVAATGMLTFGVRANSDILLTCYRHAEVLQNTTGAAANDLHVDVPHPALEGGNGNDPLAGAFTTHSLAGTPNGTMINFTGGTVANNGRTTVAWTSVFASDKISSADWTLNGAVIGAAHLLASNLQQQFIDIGGGQVMLTMENTSASPISYSDLLVVDGADSAYFTNSDFIDGMFTDPTPVSLLVSQNGAFNTGITQIAVFTPSSSLSTEYFGMQMFVDGGVIAHAGGRGVPEPTQFALFGLGIMFVLASRKRNCGQSDTGFLPV